MDYIVTIKRNEDQDYKIYDLFIYFLVVIPSAVLLWILLCVVIWLSMIIGKKNKTTIVKDQEDLMIIKTNNFEIARQLILFWSLYKRYFIAEITN